MLIRRRWAQQPQDTGGVRVRERWASRGQVFVPGMQFDTTGAVSLTKTANGYIETGALGMRAFQSSGNFNTGWTVPASGGSWDGVLCIPLTFTTRASYNVQGVSNAFSFVANSDGLIVRASSNTRISASATIKAGDPVFFVGSGADGYAAYHNGQKYTGAAGFGNITCLSICTGFERSVALVMRLPDWPVNADEEVFRLLSDPWGEVFEPRRIWVPQTAATGLPTLGTVSATAITSSGFRPSVTYTY